MGDSIQAVVCSVAEWGDRLAALSANGSAAEGLSVVEEFFSLSPEQREWFQPLRQILKTGEPITPRDLRENFFTPLDHVMIERGRAGAHGLWAYLVGGEDWLGCFPDSENRIHREEEKLKKRMRSPKTRPRISQNQDTNQVLNAPLFDVGSSLRFFQWGDEEEQYLIGPAREEVGEFYNVLYFEGVEVGKFPGDALGEFDRRFNIAISIPPIRKVLEKSLQGSVGPVLMEWAVRLVLYHEVAHMQEPKDYELVETRLTGTREAHFHCLASEVLADVNALNRLQQEGISFDDLRLIYGATRMGEPDEESCAGMVLRFSAAVMGVGDDPYAFWKTIETGTLFFFDYRQALQLLLKKNPSPDKVRRLIADWYFRLPY